MASRHLAVSSLALMNEVMRQTRYHRMICITRCRWGCQRKSPKSLKNKAVNYDSAVQEFQSRALQIKRMFSKQSALPSSILNVSVFKPVMHLLALDESQSVRPASSGHHFHCIFNPPQETAGPQMRAESLSSHSPLGRGREPRRRQQRPWAKGSLVD